MTSRIINLTEPPLPVDLVTTFVTGLTDERTQMAMAHRSPERLTGAYRYAIEVNTLLRSQSTHHVTATTSRASTTWTLRTNHLTMPNIDLPSYWPSTQ
jgi:hypothetical protein